MITTIWLAGNRCANSTWFQDSALMMRSIHILSACGCFSPFHDLTEANVLQQQKSGNRLGSCELVKMCQ